jgi:uroporphyrinogen decarboxylase
MKVNFREEVTPYERMMTALNFQKPDRVPVFPIVREWCLRQVGFTFSEAMECAEKHVFAMYWCAREFEFDAVIDFIAIHSESEAMGSKLKIPDDGPPSVVEFAVEDYDTDLAKLKIPDPWKDGRMPMLLSQTQRLKELCQGYWPVISYIQAPFRHASMLRGSDFILRDVRKNPTKLKDLMEIATQSQIAYGLACVQAGADIIFIADPMSSGDLISAKMYKEFAFPYTSRVVEEIKKTGVKTIMHICGDTTDRLESMAQTGVDCLSLDQKVDMGKAREILGNNTCLFGNVDPTNTLLFKDIDAVEQESREVLAKAATDGAFILSSGCGVAHESPAENIHAMVRMAKEFNA